MPIHAYSPAVIMSKLLQLEGQVIYLPSFFILQELLGMKLEMGCLYYASFASPTGLGVLTIIALLLCF